MNPEQTQLWGKKSDFQRAIGRETEMRESGRVGSLQQL